MSFRVLEGFYQRLGFRGLGFDLEPILGFTLIWGLSVFYRQRDWGFETELERV